MKKYLDILIFTLLFFLLFSYFSGRGQEVVQMTGLQFELAQKNHKVPAGIQANITNYTAESVTIQTCKDLSIRFNGEQLILPEDLCQEKELATQESLSIDFSENYQVFENPGTYTFEFVSGEKKFLEQAQVRYRGTLGKLFIGLFYAPVYNALIFCMQTFSYSLGWAIIALTVLLRIILLYPQHKMMVSQRKMQAIQPKIKKLQEKHKGNQQAMGMELMKLYKDEGVNPMGSCGFLLIQMPFLFVIYNIIMHITSPLNNFYLYPALADFSLADMQSQFFGIDLLQAGGVTGLVLAVTVALIQYAQVKLSLSMKQGSSDKKGVVLEKKKGEEGYNSMMPDPEMMNKFMLYGMPAMVAIFTYTLIAGVGIYWGASTLFAVFQQLFVNKIIKK